MNFTFKTVGETICSAHSDFSNVFEMFKSYLADTLLRFVNLGTKLCDVILNISTKFFTNALRSS